MDNQKENVNFMNFQRNFVLVTYWYMLLVIFKFVRLITYMYLVIIIVISSTFSISTVYTVNMAMTYKLHVSLGIPFGTFSSPCSLQSTCLHVNP